MLPDWILPTLECIRIIPGESSALNLLNSTIPCNDADRSSGTTAELKSISRYLGYGSSTYSERQIPLLIGFSKSSRRWIIVGFPFNFLPLQRKFAIEINPTWKLFCVAYAGRTPTLPTWILLSVIETSIPADFCCRKTYDLHLASSLEQPTRLTHLSRSGRPVLR